MFANDYGGLHLDKYVSLNFIFILTDNFIELN
jgi:hypothetical protein